MERGSEDGDLSKSGTNLGKGSKILLLWKSAHQSLSFMKQMSLFLFFSFFPCFFLVMVVKNVEYKINALSLARA